MTSNMKFESIFFFSLFRLLLNKLLFPNLFEYFGFFAYFSLIMTRATDKILKCFGLFCVFFIHVHGRVKNKKIFSFFIIFSSNKHQDAYLFPYLIFGKLIDKINFFSVTTFNKSDRCKVQYLLIYL